MSLKNCSMCFVIAAIVAIPVFVNPALLGSCTNQMKAICACPDPSTTTACSGLGQSVCPMNKEQQKANNDFCCVSGTGTDCIDGSTADEELCYTEWNCVWAVELQSCVVDADTRVDHMKVTKINVACGGGGH